MHDAVELTARGNEAYGRAAWREAEEAYLAAIALLPADSRQLAPLYENLGLARLHGGRADAALRAFLRALDGEPGSRGQALGCAVLACLEMRRFGLARTLLAAFERCFGPHPQVAPAALRSLEEQARRQRAKVLPG